MGDPAIENGGRREEILAAARNIFAHYGFRRAGLEEIAREAGISRTALYHHFRNKEDIFRATCDGIYSRAIANAERAVADAATLDAQLVGALEAQIGWIYRLVSNSRHGFEIVDETSRLCSDITAAATKRAAKLLARVLREAEDAGKIATARAGFTPESAANFLLLCAHGLQGPPSHAPSASQYARRLADLVRLTVAGLGGETNGVDSSQKER
ncbi:MAG: TetR/AcrR family transcriptional regulator [Deltaproteobacteria bacterium]|nr:TetR/AcrR family transcriptional regulator [Deltaproteobacteria bacterium]